MSAPDLAAFLLARIAEDEADAKDAENYFPDDGPFVRWDSARVLAECEAKRRIVERVSDVAWATYSVRDVVLELLALPYADHPDYRKEWAQ
jgi:HEAT repeat protein